MLRLQRRLLSYISPNMNDIATHLAAILGRLSQAVAAFVAVQLRGPQIVWLGNQAYVAKPQPNQPATLASETWIRLTHRISRIAQRFRTLFARYQAGTLPAPRPSRAGTPSNRHPETNPPHLASQADAAGSAPTSKPPPPAPAHSITCCSTPRKCRHSSKPPPRPDASCARSAACSASPRRNTSACHPAPNRQLPASPPLVRTAKGGRSGRRATRKGRHPPPQTAPYNPKSAPPHAPGKNTTAKAP